MDFGVEISIPKLIKAIRDIFDSVGAVTLNEVCTQDARENLFSMIRSLGGSHNSNPTVKELLDHLEKLRLRKEKGQS